MDSRKCPRKNEKIIEYFGNTIIAYFPLSYEL